MNRTRTFGAVLALLAGAASAAWLYPPPQGIERLSWMSGCWVIERGERVTEEQWMRPRGGLMLGMSRTVHGGRLAEYEATRIEQRGAALVYVAQPAGQPQAEFTASTVNDTLVVFANPTHDFPQRILYRRVGRDSLRARVEGERGKHVQGFDYPFARTACP
mgnify:CR=1 FL=1